MPTTEAQRRASEAYRKREREAGFKRIEVRIPADRESELRKIAREWCEGVRKELTR